MTAIAGRFPAMQGIDEITLKVSECKTSYDALRLTREIARAYRFEYFSIIRLPVGDERNLAQLSIIGNWPPELVSTYDQLGLLESSPIMTALRNSTKPLPWDLESIAQTDPEGRGAAVTRLFSDFDMTCGVYFPTQEASGGRGAVSFSGSRDRLTDSEILELAYFSNLIYEKAVSLRTEPYAAQPSLSGRELECLRWTANGKTSAEIALILGLSEHTINHYLSSVCNKLGATNRTHAVAKGIRSNLLD